MTDNKCSTTLRVRYSETDQMGTFYNSRALEWFEVGRTEWLRATGTAYTEMEERGVLLPLVEAHVEYHNRAKYDDELAVFVTAEFSGKARLRFDIMIRNVETTKPICSGYSVHPLLSPEGRPIRPPDWFREIIEAAGGEQS